MEKVRIGLVGISGFARIHREVIDFCEKAGLARLEAVVVRPGDRDVPEFALVAEKGWRLYGDYKEMLEAEKGRLDLIALPVGIGFHGEISIAAMKAGFHVMCEKPAAGTLEDSLDMKRVQEKTGKILAMGYQNIYSPSIQRIKQIRLDRLLGDLVEARGYVSWPRDSLYYGRNGWAGKLEAGGRKIFDSPLHNATAHFLQNLLYVGGLSRGDAVTPLSIYGENFRAQPIESADTQYIEVETAEGPVIRFSTTHATDTLREPVADYLFERGRIRWSHEGGQVFINVGGEEVLTESFDDGPIPKHARVFWDVCTALIEGREPLSTIGNSWQQVQCVNALFANYPVKTIGDKHKKVAVSPEGAENHFIPAMVELQESMFGQGTGFLGSGAAWAAPEKPASNKSATGDKITLDPIS